MRSDFDVIHGFDHRFSVSIPALVKRRWGGIPYVADWADLWGWEGIAGERRGLSGRALGWADHVWERETHRRADAVTAISSDLAARARTLGVASERIRLVQVGANVDQIRPLPKDAMRIKHGLSPGVPIVVSIGFAPYDAALLAETFAVLAHQDRDVLLILTGGEMVDVKVVAAAAGVLDRVRHLGCVPYEMLGEVLACGDVMLLPYSNRSVNAARYPNRFGDYLAAGRPIATNPTGDLGPVIAAEQIGVTAEDHPEAFAAAILALLRDPARCEIMGRCARNLAETRFSWRTIASPLEVLYQELIAEKSKAHSDSGR
jgi:glycosyltransferase involved in cell wall biosynthesis